MAAPRVWASPATSIRRSCRLTTSTEPSAVIRKTTGSANQPPGAVSQKSTSVAPIPAEPISRDRKIDQSAMIPATQVPATMPRPKDIKKIGTADSPSPPTSVTVGAM